MKKCNKDLRLRSRKSKTQLKKSKPLKKNDKLIYKALYLYIIILCVLNFTFFILMMFMISRNSYMNQKEEQQDSYMFSIH
jgi:hypothetical protein